MKTDNMHNTWYEMLPGENWKYIGTLTFKVGVTRSAAEKGFARFIIEAKKVLGADFPCAYVTEGGNTSKRLHINFLIAGIPYSPAVRGQLQEMWDRIGDIAHIARFDEAKREAGIHYTLKTVRSGESNLANFVLPDKAELSYEKKTLPSITINRWGHGYHVQREGGHLILVLPLTMPRRWSGKTNVIGSTGGPRATFAEFDGRPIFLDVVARVKPKGPAWKQRIDALLAHWEGKLS